MQASGNEGQEQKKRGEKKMCGREGGYEVRRRRLVNWDFWCKALENGDGQSMPGVTKTTHCIFLREKQSGSVTAQIKHTHIDSRRIG